MARLDRLDRTLNIQLDELEQSLFLLKIQYEKYFNGVEAMEPVRYRDDTQRLVRTMLRETSADPAKRQAMAQIRAALLRAPFSLGTLQIVEEGEKSWLALGDALVPVDFFGPAAWETLALLCEVYLDPCEILITERPGLMLERAPQVERWLKGLLEAPGGPLEQVMLLTRGQGLPIRVSDQVAANQGGRSMTRFPRR